jgi:hypothetical protein
MRFDYDNSLRLSPIPSQATSVSYSKELHACIKDEYAQNVDPIRGGASALAPHPFSEVLKSAAALDESSAGARSRGAQDSGKPIVVLIERSGSRNIPNFGTLRDALKALPITLRVFGANDGGTQADHLRLFASADVIVAPHGAGLTNSVAAWPSTVVVEFIPESGLSNLVYMQVR